MEHVTNYHADLQPAHSVHVPWPACGELHHGQLEFLCAFLVSIGLLRSVYSSLFTIRWSIPYRFFAICYANLHTSSAMRAFPLYQ